MAPPASPRNTMSEIQRFTGTLSHGDQSIAVTFAAEIDETGKLRPGFDPIPLNRETLFLKTSWYQVNPDYRLVGTRGDGVHFESSAVAIESMGTGSGHYTLNTLCKSALYSSTGHEHVNPIVTAHLRGFQSAVSLQTQCALGEVT